jgi:hypothetical protein
LSLEQRFWSLVQRGRPADCWPWIGRIHKGYGEFQYRCNNGQSRCGAHRFALSLNSQPRFSWVFACHTCDNPICCNPAHLYWGDAISNADDRVRRDRSSRRPQPGLASMSRQLHAQGFSINSISRQLAITPRAVRCAVRRPNPRKWSKPPLHPPLRGLDRGVTLGGDA